MINWSQPLATQSAKQRKHRIIESTPGHWSIIRKKDILKKENCREYLDEISRREKLIAKYPRHRKHRYQSQPSQEGDIFAAISHSSHEASNLQEVSSSNLHVRSAAAAAAQGWKSAEGFTVADHGSGTPILVLDCSLRFQSFFEKSRSDAQRGCPKRFSRYIIVVVYFILFHVKSRSVILSFFE